MFVLTRVLAISRWIYLVAVLNIPFCVALSKMWIQNNDWESTRNWNLGRLPCANDIATIELSEAAVFINSSSTVKQLYFKDPRFSKEFNKRACNENLPSSSSLVFGNSAQLIFSDSNPSQDCKGSAINFTGSGSDDWLDPNNWKTVPSSSLTLYPQQVPCEYDAVKFPKDASYNVKVQKNVTVAKVFINGKEQDGNGFQQYVASNTGIQQIYLGKSVSFNITGEECKDISGCLCGSNKEKDYICNFVTCPKLQCEQPVKPLGGCCSVCGNLMLLKVSEGFNKILVEQKIRKYLKKFTGVHFVAVKTQHYSIQVVLKDTTDKESRTARVAQSMRENLLADETLHILSIEIRPHQEPVSSSQSSGDSQLYIGVSFAGVIIVLVIVVIVVYLVMRRRTRRSANLVDDSNIGEVGDIENPAFECDGPNPLYQSSTETGNLGFNNALSSTETPENGQENSSGRENPLYEAA